MSGLSGAGSGDGITAAAGSKHKLPGSRALDAAAIPAPAASKRPRHAVLANAAFAEPILLASDSSDTSAVLSAPSPSSASLAASFDAFADSLPPACLSLMNVAIPRAILAMHDYLQHMPRFQHSVALPEQPTDDTATTTDAATHSSSTAPPSTHSSAAVTGTVSDPSLTSQSSSETDTAARATATATLPTHTPALRPVSSHPQLSALLPFLHSTLSLLLTHLSTLKLNLQLLIPPSDDSHSFGVEIQTEALAHLTAYEDIAFAALERLVVYTSNRARLLSKVVKWPLLADYYLAVRELDHGMWLDGKCIVMETRETYLDVHDLLTKNAQRLNDPKGVGHRSMAM